MDLTAWVAVYGAVVSTTVGAWTIYRSVTDRGRLRVYVYTAVQMVPGVGTIKKDCLAYKVVNVGRQPIWLKQIGGRYAVKEFLIATKAQLPCKLEPGEQFLEGEASAADILDKDKPLYLAAWDTQDAAYKFPRRELKALLKKRQAKRHVGEES